MTENSSRIKIKTIRLVDPQNPEKTIGFECPINKCEFVAKSASGIAGHMNRHKRSRETLEYKSVAIKQSLNAVNIKSEPLSEIKKGKKRIRGGKPKKVKKSKNRERKKCKEETESGTVETHEDDAQENQEEEAEDEADEEDKIEDEDFRPSKRQKIENRKRNDESDEDIVSQIDSTPPSAMCFTEEDSNQSVALCNREEEKEKEKKPIITAKHNTENPQHMSIDYERTSFVFKSANTTSSSSPVIMVDKTPSVVLYKSSTYQENFNLKEDTFYCLFFNQFHETKRKITFQVENDVWMASRGLQLVEEAQHKNPQIFRPVIANEKFTKSRSEMDFYRDTCKQLPFDLRQFLTFPDESLDSFYTRDPIYVLRRFPNCCWGIKFSLLFNFLKPSIPKITKKSWKVYIKNFNQSSFVKVVQTIYPELEGIERKLADYIAKTTSHYKKKMASSSENKEGNDSNNNDKERISKIDWSEALIPRVKDPDALLASAVQRFHEEREEDDDEDDEEEKEKMETDGTGGDKEEVKKVVKKKRKTPTIQRKGIDKHRILPIVLLPLFLASLSTRVRRANTECVTSLELLENLQYHRDELHDRVVNSASYSRSNSMSEMSNEKITCLQMTINQLKKNTYKVLHYNHLQAMDMDMLLFEQYRGLLERLTAVEITQRKTTKRYDERLKQLEEEKEGESGEEESDDSEE